MQQQMQAKTLTIIIDIQQELSEVISHEKSGQTKWIEKSRGNVMSNKRMLSKQQYLEAQNQLLDEALQGNLCQIHVYPSQNRELWLIDDTYKPLD